MAEKTEQIPVEAVRIDGGTQQRPIDKAVVTHYKELRQDGIELPVIDVVWDDANACYWLWDGFHRLEAAKDLKCTKISAHVSPGSQQDAVWLSYSANKAHGVPRAPGTVRRIIEQILCNPAYSQTPLSKIAEHVGASRRYVIEVKNALLAKTEGGREDSETFITDEAETRTDDSAKAEKGVNSSHPSTDRNYPESTPVRSEKVIVRSATGKEYQQKSQEKREPPAGPTDADGREIPEHLQSIFSKQPQFARFSQELSTLQDQVRKAITDDPVAWGRFSENAFRAAIEKCTDLLNLSGPYIVCAYCGADHADQCTACKGTGFLTKAQARCVPAEMRNV